MLRVSDHSARTDTGRQRPANEDSYWVSNPLFVLADGMGGAQAGEVASQTAVEVFTQGLPEGPGSHEERLAEMVGRANTRIHALAESDEAHAGMGTTLTAAYVGEDDLAIAHVGDSRLYVLRDGELEQLTDDHSLVGELVRRGQISAEEAEDHPQRSIITRALDGRDGVELDLSVREARPGDRYLLCTDGLTGPVGRTETLLDALRLEDPQESVDRLVQLALKGGGPDNVTVIVADVVDESRGTGTPVVAGAAASSPQAPPPGIGDSAAARARTAEGRDVEPPRTSAVQVTTPRPRASRRRAVLVGLVLLALLAVGAGTGWTYLRSQYYVGVDDGRVAVFRGVTGSLLGLHLSDVEERTGMTVDSLSEIDGARVRKGIVAADRSDADRIVARLDEGASSQVQPTPAPVPSASPFPLPAPSAP